MPKAQPLIDVDFSKFDLGVNRNVLSEYFGFWAIDPQTFQQQVAHATSINIRDHVRDHRADYDPTGSGSDDSDLPYALSGGVAQIEVVGPMMKYASSMSDNTSTVRARKQIRHAANNPDVSIIVMRFDTPGGTVSGTKDLADDIIRARSKKRVIAFVDDIVASAGYWCASQCDEIVANNSTARIGSIGTYTVVHDYSEQAKMLGIKTHVIGAGKFKGAGAHGTEVTDDQLAEWSRIVEALNDEFKSAVAIGRGFSKATVDEYADGRAHPAKVALDMKLIDSISSFEETLSRFVNPTRRQRTQMSDETPTPTAAQPATLSQLKEICSGDFEFIVNQQELGATVAQASTAFAQKMKAENDALKSSHAKELAAATEAAAEAARKEAADVAAAATTTGPILMDDDANDDDVTAPVADAVEEFNMRVEKRMGETQSLGTEKCRMQAVRFVARRDPDLHQRYVAATQATPSKRINRLIDEKFESCALAAKGQ